MTTKVKFPGNTIQLSDTVDQWGRKVHINVRNDKVTLVYRWKAKSDNRAHTQRVTLDDTHRQLDCWRPWPWPQLWLLVRTRCVRPS